MCQKRGKWCKMTRATRCAHFGKTDFNFQRTNFFQEEIRLLTPLDASHCTFVLYILDYILEWSNRHVDLDSMTSSASLNTLNLTVPDQLLRMQESRRRS
jgi:hypothetical protein